MPRNFYKLGCDFTFLNFEDNKLEKGGLEVFFLSPHLSRGSVQQIHIYYCMCAVDEIM